MRSKNEEVLCTSSAYASGSEREAGALGAHERMRRRRELDGRAQVKEMREAASISIMDSGTKKNGQREAKPLTKAEREKQVAEMRKQAKKGL